jgi:hypothetical protein
MVSSPTTLGSTDLCGQLTELKKTHVFWFTIKDLTNYTGEYQMMKLIAVKKAPMPCLSRPLSRNSIGSVIWKLSENRPFGFLWKLYYLGMTD